MKGLDTIIERGLLEPWLPQKLDWWLDDKPFGEPNAPAEPVFTERRRLAWFDGVERRAKSKEEPMSEGIQFEVFENPTKLDAQPLVCCLYNPWREEYLAAMVKAAAIDIEATTGQPVNVLRVRRDVARELFGLCRRHDGYPTLTEATEALVCAFVDALSGRGALAYFRLGVESRHAAFEAIRCIAELRASLKAELERTAAARRGEVRYVDK
jgi:hypothetical protein